MKSGEATTEPANGVSEKQLRANRENAKRSTGPRTTEGKDKSSRNAVTHGCWVGEVRPIENGPFREDAGELQWRVISLVETLDPRDQLELEQAILVARAYVRLDRVDRFEATASDGDSNLTDAELRRAGDPVRKRLRMELADLVQEAIETMAAGDTPELDDPERWELFARWTRAHSGHPEVGVAELWTGGQEPSTPEEWRLAFMTLVRHHWGDLELAKKWAARQVVPARLDSS